jgi:3-phytase
MMKVRSSRGRSAALALSVGFASCAAAIGCGGDEPGQQPTNDSRVGGVALDLEVGAGFNLTSIAFEIAGNGFLKTGSFPVNGPQIQARIGGIPAGLGFVITLRASDPGNPEASCEGSATFDVQAAHTTPVALVLRCRLPSKTGSVLVNGQLNVCPRIDDFSLAPTSASVGQSVALASAASDPDGEPSPLSFHWTASSGSLSAAQAAETGFTCTAAGSVDVTLEVSDGDCSDSVTAQVQCSEATSVPTTLVYATAETAPVVHSGDAADDPAVWVHPTDPALSVIIGTDKSAGGGLGVYALDGSLLQTLTAGALNNVDLRQGFSLGGQSTTLVTAGNRTDNSIAIFRLDAASRTLSDVAAEPITTLATYGSCMYKSPSSGRFYYFVDSKAGEIEQWELFESSTAPGKVSAVKVRELKQLSSQPEACAVDDASGALYVGEEGVGIWKFAAEPSVTSGAGWEGELVATVASGLLVADVEGLAVVSTGSTGGYLLASSQGDSTYAAFDRQAPHAFIKRFRVERGESCIDGVTGSDGIEATSQNLGPAFPHGVFVTQDDTNDVGTQNFKLVPLEFILGSAPVLDASACLDPHQPEPDAGAPVEDASVPSGWGSQYCLDFCQKCEACYATGEFSEGDCHYQTSKPNFALSDCQAGCAVSATPGVEAHATLTEGWQSLSCAGFDDAM